MSDFKGTPNTAGRPKGTPNKATAEVRNAFQKLVEDNLLQLKKDLADLEPKDRVNLILQLSRFVLPQLKAMEISDVTPDRTQPLIIEMHEN